MKSTYYYLMICIFIAMQGQQAQAQQEKGIIANDFLQIGDTIPDVLWQMSFGAANHPKGKKTIRLEDYRTQKKLIILDFWGVSCSSCIAAFEQLKDVKKEFAEDVLILPVASESREVLQKFLKTNPVTKKLNMWSVSDAKKLDEFFNYSTVPHFVWIKDGVIISHSISDKITPENLTKILVSDRVEWQQSEAVFVKKNPIINDLKYNSFDNYSFFRRGPLDGALGGRGNMPFEKDKVNIYFSNTTLMYMFKWLIFKIEGVKSTDELDWDAILPLEESEEERDRFRVELATFQAIVPNTTSYLDVLRMLELQSGYKLKHYHPSTDQSK